MKSCPVTLKDHLFICNVCSFARRAFVRALDDHIHPFGVSPRLTCFGHCYGLPNATIFIPPGTLHERQEAHWATGPNSIRQPLDQCVLFTHRGWKGGVTKRPSDIRCAHVQKCLNWTRSTIRSFRDSIGYDRTSVEHTSNTIEHMSNVPSDRIEHMSKVRSNMRLISVLVWTSNIIFLFNMHAKKGSIRVLILVTKFIHL